MVPGEPRAERLARSGRLFVALWPGAPQRRALQAWQRSIAWPPGARPTPAQDLHLTLVFVGSVDAALRDAIAAAADLADEPFELTIDRLEFWRGGLCVASPSAVPDVLARRQQVIEAALRGLGLALDERPWRPHLTLARKSAGAQVVGALPPLHWAGAGHVLAQRDGEHYAVLRRYGEAAARRRSTQRT